MKRWSRILLILLASGDILATSAGAGTGEIVDGKINLSVRFTYREADADSWRPLFEESSRLLYNATNGQLQFGRIRVSGCGGGKNDADVWILTGVSGAFANLLGLSGQGHIYLSQVHKSTTGIALGQFGLVHEMGHYGFGLYDEYKGVSPPMLARGSDEQVTLSDPHQFCTTEEDLIACMMDGGTTIEPNHLRTEFCTNALEGLTTRHNSGVEIGGILYENAQQVLNGESCWETMSRIVGLEAPVQVEILDPPGLQPIEWETVPSAERVVLCLDRSASMLLRPDKLALAKELAGILTGFLHGRKTVEIDGEEVTLAGERLAVADFADEAGVRFPFREILSDATKDSARAVIDAIAGEAAGNHLSTDLTAGLRTSLDLLETEGGIPACSEAIVLFSDGAANQGGDPFELVPDLRARRARVFSVGMGKGPAFDLLRGLADSTEGQFFQAGRAEDLNAIAQAIAEEVRSQGQLGAIHDSTSGQDEHQSILIDGFAEEVTVVLLWDQGALDMVLTSPSGDVIDYESAAEREDVEAFRDAHGLYLRVVNPEAGEWDALVHPTDVPGQIAYSLEMVDENLAVSVVALARRQPDTVKLWVHSVAGVPTAGGEVKAAVERPSGPPVALQVLDNGDPANGDTWADDGVYTALFDQFTTNGTYTFYVTVECHECTGPDPSLPFVEDGPGPPTTIPPFYRETAVSITVDDLQPAIAGDLTLEPHTLMAPTPAGLLLCTVELPAPHLPGEIFANSIRLEGIPRLGSVPPEIGDADADGIEDLTVAFDPAAVFAALPSGADIPVRVTGTLLDDLPWEAAGRLAVLEPAEGAAVTLAPEAPETGSSVTISWPPTEASPVTYSGHFSADDGESWERVFEGYGEESFTWRTPETPGTGRRFLVQTDSPEGVIRQVLSDPFEILAASSAPGGEVARTAFLGVRPNPAAGETTLRFALAHPTSVLLEIYDVTGRRVRTLLSGSSAPGTQSATWNGLDDDGRPVASGAYLYRFEAGEVRASGRVLLVR